MAPFLLYTFIMALLSEVQCFRTPLPFGTGFQGATQVSLYQKTTELQRNV